MSTPTAVTLAAIAALGVTRTAWADPPERPERPYTRAAVTIDPLGALDSRFGAQVEVVIDPNASIAVSPWIISMRHQSLSSFYPGDADISDMTVKASGVDTQLRLYPQLTGRKHQAPDGLFIAPGVVLQRFEVVSHLCSRPDGGFGSSSCGNDTAQKWAYYGPSLDVGYQYVFPYGLVGGLSVGVHYRFATEDIDTSNWSAWSTFLHGPGLRPRLRGAIGFGF